MSLDDLKSDLAAVEAIPPRNFKEWLVTADPASRELVLASILTGTIGANKLTATLKKNGIPITRETIVGMRDDAR